VLKTLSAAAAAAIFAAGCSAASGSGDTVFRNASPAPAGTHISGMVLAGQRYIYDIMVAGLHNYTSHSVRLTSIRLVSPHRAAIRVLNITAYPLSRIAGGTAFVDEGDLAKGCPQEFAPHPVTDVVMAPHSDANFAVYIALVMLKPGHYNFGRTRITYISNGQPGSEVYYLPNIHLRTVPRSSDPHLYEPDVCG
jgi:hypothetical protein